MNRAAAYFCSQITQKTSLAVLPSHRSPIEKHNPLSAAHPEVACAVVQLRTLLCRPALFLLSTTSRAHRDTLCFRLGIVVHSSLAPFWTSNSNALQITQELVHVSRCCVSPSARFRLFLAPSD